MFHFPNPQSITPKQFEEVVRAWFEHFPDKLQSFEAEHLETHIGVDGDYEIDITVRFTAFGGAEFLVLCECKKFSNPIERGLLQILNDKKRSISAHKAMMVATAAFQSGAIEYAERNRIGLVEIRRGNFAYITNSSSPSFSIPENADPFCGMMSLVTKDGIPFPMRLTSWDTMVLEEFFRDIVNVGVRDDNQSRDDTG